jgi:hypothetical protein
MSGDRISPTESPITIPVVSTIATERFIKILIDC